MCIPRPSGSRRFPSSRWADPILPADAPLRPSRGPRRRPGLRGQPHHAAHHVLDETLWGVPAPHLPQVAIGGGKALAGGARGRPLWRQGDPRAAERPPAAWLPSPWAPATWAVMC